MPAEHLKIALAASSHTDMVAALKMHVNKQAYTLRTKVTYKCLFWCLSKKGDWCQYPDGPISTYLEGP